MGDSAAVQLALAGIITTAITTAGIIIVAIINNRRERSGAAEEGIEATLRERILLRDERISDLKESHERALEDKLQLQIKLDQALEEIDEKTMLVVQLTSELERLQPGEDEG